MKTLFIMLTVFALCTQQVSAMENKIKTQKKTEKEQFSNSTYPLVVKLFCAAVFVGVAGHVITHDSMQQEWNQMQNDCWDPCLKQPYFSRHQQVTYEDNWLERVWDARIPKYQDELNCSNHEQVDMQRQLEGCKRLDTMEVNDQQALACITNMQASGQNLTSAIMHIQEKIDRRYTHRTECREWPQYILWKQEHTSKNRNTYSPCDGNSPYQSIEYRGHQPYVADTRLCRLLQPSDCEKGNSMRSFIESLGRQPLCKKLSNVVNKDGDSDKLPSSKVIATLHYLNREFHEDSQTKFTFDTAEWTERECSVWQTELEKKNQ
jgi:hypothetical protein